MLVIPVLIIIAFIAWAFFALAKYGELRRVSPYPEPVVYQPVPEAEPPNESFYSAEPCTGTAYVPHPAEVMLDQIRAEMDAARLAWENSQPVEGEYKEVH